MNLLLRLLIGCALTVMAVEGGFVIWVILAVSDPPSKASAHTPDATAATSDADSSNPDAAEPPTFRDGIFERAHRADAGELPPPQENRGQDYGERQDEPTSPE